MYIIDKFKIMTYNVGFVNTNINSVLKEGMQENEIIWLKHKYKDRYFADPFLIKEDESNFYILVEEFIFWEEKGKIVLLIVDKATCSLLERRLVIEEEWHLSFPYCKLGENWIIPEASASNKTYAYMIDDEYKILKRIKIADEGLIDNVYYQDENGDRWCYAGKTIIPSTELYEYKYINEKKKFVRNIDKPIQKDNRHSRGAGDFFYIDGELYRPVQDCKGRYGRQTKVMKIDSIGVNGYKATEVATLNSFNNKPFNETMHTFNVYEHVIIVDGSKDFIRFPMKIFYKKFRGLFKWKK